MRRRTVAVVLSFLALLATAAVLAQGASGSVSGKVTDENGRPVAGAVVTVTSSLLQGPRTQSTDGEGEFLIPYLPPGTDYSVTVEAGGYAKVRQSKVQVFLGSTIALQFALASSAGSVVEVSSQPPILDAKHTRLSTNLTQSDLEFLPVGRQVEQSFYLAPNVVESGLSAVAALGVSNPGVKGSTGSENIYLINGMNITDPVGGILVGAFNYNFVREIAVNTAGLGAEYGSSTGGLFSILTKSGSNEFHGEFFGYYTDQSLSAGTAPVSPGALNNQPFTNYDYGFDLGGPILKDRLWFFVGYNPTYTSQHYAGNSLLTNVYTGQGAAIPYEYDSSVRNWVGMAKFNYRLNEDHQLELTFLTTPQHAWLNEGVGNFLGGAPIVPVTNPSARMTRRYQSGWSAGLKWYANWRQNFYMETEIAHIQAVGQVLPWTEEGYGQPQILSYDWTPSVSVGWGTGIMDWDNRYSTQFDSKVTYLVNRHEIKFGVQYEKQKWDAYNGYTGGVQYQVQGLFPFASDPFSPNLNDYAVVTAASLQNPHWKTYGRYLAGFAQDNWSITDHLNLAYGVRWEQNSLLPESGQHASLDSWSPRIGFTWDFAENGKSKAFLSWGRYYQRLPIAASYTMDPGHARYYDTYFLGNLVNHYVYGALPSTVLGGTKNQYNDEWMAGAEYQFTPDFTLGFSALYRTLGDVLEDSAYLNDQGGISYYLMNPGTGQWPAVMDRWAYVFPDYQRFAHPIRNYSAYTLTASKRLSRNWFLSASYTLSFLKGNYEGGSGGYGFTSLAPNISSAYDFPQAIYNANRYGWLPQDVRHMLKVQAGYRFDFGFALGANLHVQSGRPLNKVYQYPLSGPGWGELYAAPRGENRMPGLWQLDLHAEQSFKIATTYLTLFADLFNVTNRQTATDMYQWYYQRPATLADVYQGHFVRDPNWGRATRTQSPRSLRLGMKLSF
jgi:hypothetical protein